MKQRKDRGLARRLGPVGPFLAAAFLLANAARSQDARISEFMAINDSFWQDRDGEYSDWIELQNLTASNISLSGWSLTDSAAAPRKWVFPAVTLPARGFLVVFASGKDRTNALAELHTNFKLDGGGEYLALVRPDGSVADEFSPAYPPQEGNVSYGDVPGTTAGELLLDAEAPCRALVPRDGALGASWTAPDFDDSGWRAGLTGVGYDTGTTPLYAPPLLRTDVRADMEKSNATCYVRVPFAIAGTPTFDALRLEVKYDDGFAATLNGVPLASAYAPEPLTWNSTATFERPDAEALSWQAFACYGAGGLLRPGTNVLALHGLNRELSGRPSRFLVLPRLFGTALTFHRGYLAAPTPGLSNEQDAGLVAGPIVFTPPGGVYTQSLAVTLAVTAGVAEIRYTLDGTEPATNSPLYQAPIPVGSNVLLRARAFLPGLPPGRIHSHSYLLLAADLQAFSSDLPIIVVDNFGAADYPASEPKLPAVVTVFDRCNGWSAFTNGPTLTTRAGVRRRGESTMRATSAKPNLGVETRGEGDADHAVALLGMPADSDWVFYAPYDLDCTLIHTPLTFDLLRELGQYACRTRYAEVFLKANSGPLSYAQHYAGVYVITERIKRGDQRVDIARLSVADNTEPNVSGGYIFRRDKPDPDVSEFVGGGVTLQYYEPSEGQITAAQKAWLKNHLDAFAAVLNGTNFAHPVQGYAPYIDTANWIDNNLINMLTGNIDWPALSTYLHKDRNGPIRQGPAWDCDRALECAGDSRDDNPRAWDAGAPFFTLEWWHRLFQDPDFWQRYVDRWQEARRGPLSLDALWERIAAHTNELGRAQERNFQKWANLAPRFGGWAGEVHNMWTWLTNRIDFIDGSFPAPPALTPSNRLLSAGATVTLTAATNLTIYYTLDGSDPRAPGGAPAPTAVRYTGPLTIERNTPVTARATDGLAWQGAPSHAPWSGPARAVYVTDPPPLAVTEVMYHPRDPTPAQAAAGWSSGDFEFIELQNTGARPAWLWGVRLSDGVEFDFSTGRVTRLEPGEYALVVRNEAAFSNRYPQASRIKIAGVFAGALDDGGERVELTGPLGDAWAFAYSDGRGWPEAADGAGHSLVPRALENQGRMLDYGGNWRASAYRDGSPGDPDPEPPRSVVLNEIMAHTDYSDPERPEYDSNDWLELFNVSDAPLALEHWYLSDKADNLKRWAIPAAQVIAARGRLFFDEISGFHSPVTNGFGISKDGDAVYLSYLPGDGTDRVADCIRFQGQEPTLSLGRYPDGGERWSPLPPTPAAPNAAPLPGVAIVEIMFHPPPAGTNTEENLLAEYLEIANLSTQPAPLWYEAGPWRLAGGVGYVFPPDTTLAAGETALLVPFDPVGNPAALADFLALYGLTNGQARLFGPYGGKLGNRGDRVALEKPQSPDDIGADLSWVVADEVIYFDRAPWPEGADGTGRSLQRWRFEGFGNDPADWSGALPRSPAAWLDKVAIVRPEPGAGLLLPFRVPIVLFADATRLTGPVREISLFVDGAPVRTDGEAPFELDWDSARDGVEAPGPRELRGAVVDEAGTNWSAAVPVRVLRVQNGAVGGLTHEAAVLKGRLDGGTAEVFICWGPADGGTNADAWAHCAALGARGEGEFELPVSGLQPQQPYYYRCWARTAQHAGWAAAGTRFVPSLSGWTHRLQVRFAGYDRPSVLRDFPALVALGPHIEGFGYEQFAAADGSDLRFTDAGGTNWLAYDIERWDTNGTSYVWVRVPALAGSNDCVWAYWGHPAGVGGATNGRAVWAANFQGVWHGQDGAADAAGRCAATNHGAAPAPGMVGGGLAFDGATAWFDPGLSAAWYTAQATTGLTVSFWTRPQSATGTVFGEFGGGWTHRLAIEPAGTNWVFTVKLLTSTNAELSCALEQWQMLALVFENGLARPYRNGVAAPTPLGAAGFTFPLPPAFGARRETNGLSRFYAGVADELRVAAAARSADWLWAEYLTVASNAVFARCEKRPLEEDPDANRDGLPDAWQRRFFGDPNLPQADPEADSDGDGMRNHEEYVAGTDPTDVADLFRLRLESGAAGDVVWFQTVATDSNYPGLWRYYTLESATNLPAAVWQGLPGYQERLGDNRVVAYTNAPAGRDPLFLRGRVRLSEP